MCAKAHMHTSGRGVRKAKEKATAPSSSKSACGVDRAREGEGAFGGENTRENLLRISVTILRLSAATKLPYQSPCCCKTLKELKVPFKRQTQ